MLHAVAEFKFKQMNVTVNETDKYATICVGVDRILEPGRNIMIVVTAQTRFKADAVNAATGITVYYTLKYAK